jgi:hypothetical protein
LARANQGGAGAEFLIDGPGDCRSFPLLAVLRAVALPIRAKPAMPPPAVLFADLIFGLIGIAAFTYGRKNALWRPTSVGVALIVFPYFVSQTWLLYAIGLALCGVLYIWRD